MTHELKNIFAAYKAHQQTRGKAVLATVVALEGSSYRRPGVRMLLLDNGKMVGAVSGGCVEKEIQRQAESVFGSGIPKMMTYDGRYRLGCEGILYILIEPFIPDETAVNTFWQTIEDRKTFELESHFTRQENSHEELGTLLKVDTSELVLRPNYKTKLGAEVFQQKLTPCFKLVIIGSEHDAVQLCSYASMTGWEVTVITSPSEEKGINDFPGAKEFHALSPEEFQPQMIDNQTGVVLMTHSYVKDLKFLVSLMNVTPTYLGLLGPSSRRERLLNELVEYNLDISDDFFESIYGPAGINIGAETPQEISISIISEILAVIRKKDPMLLRNKLGTIHN
ncbi:XdhC family protein [uncultured Eudoraea sp.]|uniref:XdhC family protein n=1 Tax=uncultured Eudoraea sp. TaxID=1035614 RepID=UPI0026365623|nr:XdhC/CoxI family protein [uncultured Eudoraea sp.]